MQELAGRWALVTGASSGIGEAFARLLAREGMHVALAARREDRLRKLAGELAAAHGVRTHVTALDLAREGAAETLHAATERAGLAVDLLVNNAGLAFSGPTSRSPGRASARCWSSTWWPSPTPRSSTSPTC
jgi:short-subunit dehydrogenase